MDHHEQGFQIRDPNITLSLQLLSYHFKLCVSRFDLLLVSFGTLFQVTTDIAHISPPRAAGL
jgi:hypothetical protein